MYFNLTMFAFKVFVIVFEYLKKMSMYSTPFVTFTKQN